MVELLHHRFLALQDMVLLGPLQKNLLGRFEGSKAKLLPVHCGVADIKPLLLQVLDGLAYRKGKEKNRGTDGNDTAAEQIDSAGAGLPLHGIELPEEAKVRLDTEPALAESDETSDVE
jgi:hypothetical protein